MVDRLKKAHQDKQAFDQELNAIKDPRSEVPC